jgi:Tfp pilus assembly protein PilX
LLLSAFTLLVGSAFSANQWQLRIQSNQSSEDKALLAARSAQRWAEQWLLRQAGSQRPLPCASDCGANDPLRLPQAMPAALESQSEHWWLANAFADGMDPAGVSPTVDRQQPGTPLGRWLIIEIHQSDGPDDATGTTNVSYYRIVARAARAPRGTPVIVESILARPWGSIEFTAAVDEAGNSGLFCQRIQFPGHCGRMGWQRRL